MGFAEAEAAISEIAALAACALETDDHRKLDERKSADRCSVR
jgi:hypothetical protein